MKILLYGLILTAVLLIPNQGTDVGKLIPVEVIAVSEDNGLITVRTDTGDLGNGRTMEEAFWNLKETAPGVIYLDTAEYLLLEPGTGINLSGYLKENTKVYHAAEGIQMEGIANYLSAHRSNVRLKELSDVTEIPTVVEQNGRYQLIQK